MPDLSKLRVLNGLNKQPAQGGGQSISYRLLGTGPRKIIFFHGFPGSSVQIELFRSATALSDCTILCVDRPGYNLTEVGNLKSYASQLSATNEVVHEVLNHLSETSNGHLGAHRHWNEFEVIGISGGTPFSLAFTRSEPKRVRRLTIVSGLGPFACDEFREHLSKLNQFLLGTLRFIPMKVFSAMRPRAGRKGMRPFLLRHFFNLSPSDAECMRDHEVLYVMDVTLSEAFYQDGLGAKRDAQVYTRPWAVNLGNYQGPVEIWHGKDDQILHAAMAMSFASAFVGSQVNVIENEGHYSLALKHIDSILGSSANSARSGERPSP